MKILEQTEKYVLLGNNEGENITTYDDEVQEFGGQAFNVGEVTGDPESEERSEVTRAVLYDWGLDTEPPVEIIVIKDKEWADKIIKEINETLNSNDEEESLSDKLDKHLEDQNLTWKSYAEMIKKDPSNLKRQMLTNINKLNEWLSVIGVRLEVVKDL